MLKGNGYIERSIRAVDSPADDLAIVHENAANRRFVGRESELGHLDGFAHEDFVVLAVGDGAEDHDCGF